MVLQRSSLSCQADILERTVVAERLIKTSKREIAARRPDWLPNAVVWCVWLYVAFLAAVCLLLYLGGDRWWFATLILFGPRWFCALPLVVLGPLALWLQRAMLRHLLAAALIIVGPLMGLCVPCARLAVPDRPAIRVLTCNVKGHCRNNEALHALLRAALPDIVALQGCWPKGGVDFPDGWHLVQQGELLVASRYPLKNLEVDASQRGPRVKLLSCLVTTPDGDVCFSTLHPRSPHQSFDKLLDRRTILRPSRSGALVEEIADRWKDAEEVLDALAETGPSRMIVGDLNLPPESVIYRQFWSGYHNAFNDAGWGFGYTEWPKMRKLWFGIRIDHILTSSHWRAKRCWVGPDVGSDHLPVIADLVRVLPPKAP